MSRAYSLLQNGDAALDIRFKDAPSEQLSECIIALACAIEAAKLPGVRELVPAYQCLTVCYDPLHLPARDFETAPGIETEPALTSRLRTLIEDSLAQPARPADPRRVIRIPVCYQGEYAPDMHTLSEHTGLTASEIIERHSTPHYLVHMLGFTPGFLYLGGLDTSLHCPRKHRPALQVPAGSVGIGGSQTGIYPQATPGGWQIIGRTPLQLFLPRETQPFIAQPLDRVQFVPISPEAFVGWDASAKPETERLQLPATESTR
ncbi:5-oxoprolinase subunit PxpB [Microbulbifer aggregans]|uniref:5-oxoprolinase subunit PxpB n=1 Tax=Microbulbifer aggregans TaxID=1769779 RepID=UPI001CFD27E1|nr:5-oxoprolinase subunit PxpB [Microbulbifer aggregans]